MGYRGQALGVSRAVPRATSKSKIFYAYLYTLVLSLLHSIFWDHRSVTLVHILSEFHGLSRSELREPALG